MTEISCGVSPSVEVRLTKSQSDAGHDVFQMLDQTSEGFHFNYRMTYMEIVNVAMIQFSGNSSQVMSADVLKSRDRSGVGLIEYYKSIKWRYFE